MGKGRSGDARSGGLVAKAALLFGVPVLCYLLFILGRPVRLRRASYRLHALSESAWG